MLLFHLHKRFLSAFFISSLCLLGATPSSMAETGVSSNEIIIGHDVILTGPVAERFKLFNYAADAYFASINAAGGVYGRKIRLVRMDSANKPDKTKANIAEMDEKHKVFAFWGIAGTGSVAAALPYANEKKIPLIGSTSGAEQFYAQKQPYLINLKASYRNEIERIAKHLQTVGINKVGVLYMDNGFGKDTFKSAQVVLAEGKFNVTGTAMFKEDASDISTAAATLAKGAPDAVLLLSLAGSANKAVEAYLATGTRAQFFALSVTSSDGLYKALGERARGIVVTQTVPFAWDSRLAISREYQQLMTKAGTKDFTMVGMEGFLLAKMLVEGLQAAGKDLTRDKLIESYEKMRSKDLGGIRYEFSPDDHNGSNLVLITMIGRDGKLVN